jgi:hypothetical protein
MLVGTGSGTGAGTQRSAHWLLAKVDAVTRMN